MHQKLKFDNQFWINLRFKKWYIFRLYTKQSAGGKCQERKQLKFAQQLDKFAYWKLALRNLMFRKRN